MAGAAGGLALWALGEQPGLERGLEPLAAAAPAGAIALAFTLDRPREGWAIAFAAAMAGIVGLLTWGWMVFGEGGWRPAMAALFSAAAIPAAGIIRERGGTRLDWPALHRALWSAAIIALGAIIFAAAVAAVLALWAGLFELVGIEAFARLFSAGWFVSITGGASLALGVSLLRDWDATVTALLRVVGAIAGVLAPVLAMALLLFLAVLPFTGLAPLWQATRATTPILLGAILAALLLANAVIADAGASPARSRLLALAAAGLGGAMLPLALIAALSLGKRVVQHGWSPDRLWAATFIAIALAWALLYALALLRGRARWRAAVPGTNLPLLLGSAALALLLATPLVSMEHVAARAQEARLLADHVAPEDFDFAALRGWGEAGSAALGRLAAQQAPLGPAVRAELAALDRLPGPAARGTRRERELARDRELAPLRAIPIQPPGAAWPEGLLAAMVDAYLDPCAPAGDRRIACLLWVAPSAPGQPQRAWLFRRSCPMPGAPGDREPCQASGEGWVRGPEVWMLDRMSAQPSAATLDDGAFAAVARGRLEVREETRRALFVDGRRIADLD
jgi:hypothetical protein